MKKINYKGRCEKRKVSKCKDVCRTYSKIQYAYLDVLENDEDVLSFECNVCLEGVADSKYSSDFVIKMSDGSTRVRECVWRNNLNKPSYLLASSPLYTISSFGWRRKRRISWQTFSPMKNV